jgi:Major tropism determinant N-terminal domain
MPTQVQFRRGTNAQNQAFTGAVGEITVDTTLGTLHVHDGVTAGGNTLVRANGVIYGSTIYQNNVRVFKNSTASSAPSSPVAGDEWYDSSSDILYKYVYDGTNYQWVDTSQTVNYQTLAVTGNATVGGYLTAQNFILTGNLTPQSNISSNIGSISTWYSNVYAVRFNGISVQAQYADLAENYVADEAYAPGTVVVFGGEKEITTSAISHDVRAAGVISTDPAYLMNDGVDGLPVALTGRVPCLVKGPVDKGDRLVNVAPGVAGRLEKEKYEPGCIIGKSLNAIEDDSVKLIEIAVGRY